ncbi:VOC family protein [Amycolatopsis echigonensis]|uniref:Catechol 2,3-dioxygenase-like lactoylglutathione lyase family enzyme n=1 Tax=Amycolatopsis echigonensis TaxID=2576905 RepID=A0A2N3W9J7_9PSEU|nr:MULTISPECIES: VOC family protein [Amycolatopsis]MBB2498233.1 VOC family protein [Amycolatopsis echigonensis]PKV90540.1 catechol 2,3-dioxygenase-like lactoylglutathione lyase family enzyme [Amycolatopsis niigatensis]
MKLTATVLDAPDPRALAEFYRELLGWRIGADEPEWVTLRPPGGGAGLSFQLEPQYVPPVWPADAGQQQMQLHLDFEVDGRAALEAAVAKAVAAEARIAEFQPQRNVRVLRDPAGHPFCFWTDDRP